MNVLDFTALRAEIKRGLSGGYLFCGEEAYLCSHALEAARASVLGGGADAAFNHIKLDAAAPGECDVEGAVCELPVFAEKRLVELHGFDVSHMKAEPLRELCEALALLPANPQTVLILVLTPYELDMSGYPRIVPKPFAELSPLLTPVLFSRETPAGLVRWVLAHFTHGGIRAQTSAAEALIACCGCDMFNLSGEIDKLCAYIKAHGRSELTADDINTVCSRVAVIEAFDFSNAILARNFERSMYILEDYRNHRTEPVVVMSAITRAYTQMTMALAFDADGCSAAETAKKLKIKEYPAKLQLAAARRLGEAKLKRALELCGDADYKMKFTAADGYVIISRLLACLSNL